MSHTAFANYTGQEKAHDAKITASKSTKTYFKRACWVLFGQIIKAYFRQGEKEDLTDMNTEHFLSTKVQLETLSISCGEDWTQHFRGAYFSLLLVQGRVWLRQAAVMALKKNRKQPA